MWIRALRAEDAGAAAAVHALMPEPWDAPAWRRMLAEPAILGFGAESAESLAGVVLVRAAADEVEVLTIAVAPDHRRGGIGCRLLDAALAEAARRGARHAFLEVAIDNAAAIGLYRKAGFANTGRRPGYYRSGNGPKDALIMHRPLQLDDGARPT